MATRSFIAIRTPKGFRGVYCHWDGYPSHHLPILYGHYPTADKVRGLLKPGGISCLRTRNTWASGATIRDAAGNPVTDGEGLWRSVGDREPQPLYYCERGETSNGPRRFGSLEALANWADSSGCQHVYLFDPASEVWQHSPIERGPDGSAILPGCDPSQW